MQSFFFISVSVNYFYQYPFIYSSYYPKEEKEWNYEKNTYRYATGACLDGCQAKSSQTDRHKVIELIEDGYKMRFRHIHWDSSWWQ